MVLGIVSKIDRRRGLGVGNVHLVHNSCHLVAVESGRARCCLEQVLEAGRGIVGAGDAKISGAQLPGRVTTTCCCLDRYVCNARVGS